MSIVYQLFPNKKHKILFYVLPLFVFIFLLFSPIGRESKVYQLFYTVTQDLWSYKNPYVYHDGLDYFKYGPVFLYFPMSFLYLFPLKFSGVLWQFISATLYLVAVVKLFGQWATISGRQASYLFTFFLSLFLVFDLQTNGLYLQSNTYVLAFMLWGIYFYETKRYIFSALCLIYISHVKVYPVILILLLVLDRQWRFVGYLFMFSVILSLIPYLQGINRGLFLYKEWFILIFKENKFSLNMGEIHHYFSINPFLKVNFDWVIDKYYFLIMLMFGVIIGVLLAWKSWKYAKLKQHFQINDMKQILCLTLSYILIFNPRTEGPSLILMAPIYGVFIWGFYGKNLLFKKKIFNYLFKIVFFTMILLLSFIITDFFKGTTIQSITWNYNLRTIGLIFFFICCLFSLVNSRLYNQLFK